MPSFSDFFLSAPGAQTPNASPWGQLMSGFGKVGEWSNNNPGALDAMAAGLLQGSPAAGLAGASQMVSASRQRRNEENLTKQWLMQSRGLSEMDADAAIANPAILTQMLKTPEQQSLMNVGDGNIYDPNSGEWIQAPGGTQKAPQIIELFDEATGQPYKAQWNPDTGGYERVGGVKARSGMSLRTNPDGSVELTQGDLGGMPKLTDAEGRNSGFYGRGAASHKIITDLEQEGTSLTNSTLGRIPIAGNYIRTQKEQKYDQAKRDFINAVLRRESGAVITPEEFANAEQQYFPQPGDGPDVIAQKRLNRETTIRGLEISAGQGAQFATQPPSSGSLTPGNRTSGGIQWSIED